MVHRIYVEKKPDFAVEAAGVLSDLRTALQMDCVSGLRILCRYDLEDIDPADFERACVGVFAEPQVDVLHRQLPPHDGRILGVEYLPGQYDQRADSAAQCIQIMTCKERPTAATARIYLLEGDISGEQWERIKGYLINPVESREASLSLPDTIKLRQETPPPVERLAGFITLGDEALSEFVQNYGLAMDADDLRFCRDYFKEQEGRDPTVTEIRMIDTYWSDHCRHTTFLTRIKEIHSDSPILSEAFERYMALRGELYAGRTDKPVTLMDLAVIGAKALKARGQLPDLDESEEINACSVKIKVDVDGADEDWLLMFKNETHNHPTEIEPFGGAATCLGGAIRDPLSGRSYVYQAMRVTGASDPLLPISETMAGKLPQRKIVTTAAAGYSSYGNQIGLATGHVSEIYHTGYVAKRMEIGAVVGAAPAGNVRRECPQDGDVVILLGGRTGRDGCGGATGSSKSHTAESLGSCGAEVQKGNPPEERKLQRLFRDPAVTSMIKRCNDFGAGGVSVAIGELADGLKIDLSKVPKKYDGLDGTELAISESQERMAVVVASEDMGSFIAAADKENLEATHVATVTAEPRLVMSWNDEVIVDLSREFLNSNGAPKETVARMCEPTAPNLPTYSGSIAEQWKEHLSELNICSQKGLVERFDSTIGGGTVLMPYGGAWQLSPSQAMAAKIPVLNGHTDTCSLMAWGYDPRLTTASPYHGSFGAVVESVAKVVAAGGSRQKTWLSFQEYFERMTSDPTTWGKPFAALLGALDAQMALGCGAIGGKDSMSGSFEQLKVPPTLVSFAVSVASVKNVVSTDIKKAGEKLYLLMPKIDKTTGLPDTDSLCALLDRVESLIAKGDISASWVLGYGGIAEGVFKMCVGGKFGFDFSAELSHEELFHPMCGGIMLSTSGEIPDALLLGQSIEDYTLKIQGQTVDMQSLCDAWEGKLQPVFPYLTRTPKIIVPTHNYAGTPTRKASQSVVAPRVLIPVFPGTNCEYDTARAFEQAGAQATVFVVRNRTAEQIVRSVKQFAGLVAEHQIIALPGGFSGGDEPDGSGKFITAFLRSPAVAEAVHRLIKQGDGLMCGICNGFQALIKLGLVPFGEIVDMKADHPTLTFNRIGRHQSYLAHTRVASNKSPWLMHSEVGDIHTVAISHGEGRFVASDVTVKALAMNGQIATQYVDLGGAPTLDVRFNPNESIDAIEGITSPDGRVFGKMGHSERSGDGVFLNVAGEKDQKIFRGAVDYFRG